MMNTSKNTIVSAALMLTLSASQFAVSTPAFAIKGDHTRFNTCKTLKASGKIKWYGIATGTEEDVFAVNPNSRSFHVRACFATQQACKTWVKRIWWEIPTMDELSNAWCKRA